jgi:dTDP-4-dehydrorhamnose 3,5-epimerase-like enzyme
VPHRGSTGDERGTAPVFRDPRGTLTLVPFEEIPFTPIRAYVLHSMPAGARRGGHACRVQRRLLVGLTGRSTVVLDDGRDPREQSLGGGETLLIEPGTWHEIETLDDEAAILVFADGAYDPGDYIADRSQVRLAASTAAETDAT